MTHLCHAAKCKIPVEPRMLMCRKHWYMLPKPAQRIIWYYYRHGQEITKEASPQYMLAQACAVAIVAFKSKAWGSLEALNHVARASNYAQTVDKLELVACEEIIRAMGCETLAQ